MHHYVQVPTCGASRYCMLTGKRPKLHEALNNDAIEKRLRSDVEPAVPESWPHLFRRAGYRTVLIGKVSHYPDGRIYKKDAGSGEGRPEMPYSWSEYATPTGKWQTGWNAFFGYGDGSGRQRGASPPTEAADVDDSGYPDGLIADCAIANLKELEQSQEPFVLAVGFFKPHLPFNAPRRYWELYDRGSLPSAPHPGKPAGISPRSHHGSGEMFGNYGHPRNSRRDDAHLRKLRHGYFASVSYVDGQIGRLVRALDASKLARSTIVVVWGDHGWHLGDHDIWGKAQSLRAVPAQCAHYPYA